MTAPRTSWWSAAAVKPRSDWSWRARCSQAPCRSPPRGPTYHLWLPLPARWRAESFTAQARRRGVSVTPAELFTVGPATAPAAVRVCQGAPRTRASLEKGLRRLRETLEGGPEPLASIV
jgi:DNA-binding transcriptional MocR family regulator